MAYYNTTRETQAECSRSIVKNMKQDEIVFMLAKGLKKPFSPSIILDHYPNPKPPMTSIRRAINTLYHKQKVIERLEEKRKGRYGVNEFQYRVTK